MNRRPDARFARWPRAFSLLEMMLVLVIIGLVAGLITYNVRSQLGFAKRSAARADLSTIENAIEQYHLVHGRYPSQQKGLEALTESTEELAEPLLDPTDLEDPWDHPYVYNRPGLNGKPFEVMTYGADGERGGEGGNADLVNWQIEDRSGEA